MLAEQVLSNLGGGEDAVLDALRVCQLQPGDVGQVILTVLQDLEGRHRRQDGRREPVMAT